MRSNYISPFRYKKTPENLDFPGFLNHFDIVCLYVDMYGRLAYPLSFEEPESRFLDLSAYLLALFLLKITGIVGILLF